ncbi:MAG: hypothetical protein HMLKMBBP_02960 [Planctomycetes bacterium]|nr:hypothetical protein [Planctomycetota bacterium]
MSSEGVSPPRITGRSPRDAASVAHICRPSTCRSPASVAKATGSELRRGRTEFRSARRWSSTISDTKCSCRTAIRCSAHARPTASRIGAIRDVRCPSIGSPRRRTRTRRRIAAPSNLRAASTTDAASRSTGVAAAATTTRRLSGGIRSAIDGRTPRTTASATVRSHAASAASYLRCPDGRRRAVGLPYRRSQMRSVSTGTPHARESAPIERGFCGGSVVSVMSIS